jgi:DinB superfamily
MVSGSGRTPVHIQVQDPYALEKLILKPSWRRRKRTLAVSYHRQATDTEEQLLDLELTYIKHPDGSRTLNIPEERKALAIAYLHDGGLKSAVEIEAMVDEGHGALMHAIDGLSAAQAAYKPAADEWSVLELMGHVVTGKQLVAALCASLAGGQLPPRFGPALEAEAAQDGVTVARFETLETARAAACEAHAALLEFVRSADGPVNVEMTFRHFVFGALNCRGWAAFQRLHDDDHRPQVDTIRTTAGFPAS